MQDKKDFGKYITEKRKEKFNKFVLYNYSE